MKFHGTFVATRQYRDLESFLTEITGIVVKIVKEVVVML